MGHLISMFTNERNAIQSYHQSIWVTGRISKPQFRTRNDNCPTGNDNLNLLTITTGKRYKLRFDLADFSGNYRYAEYDNFIVLSSSNLYKLASVGLYTGTAGEQHDNTQCTNARGTRWYRANIQIYVESIFSTFQIDRAPWVTCVIIKNWRLSLVSRNYSLSINHVFWKLLSPSS